MPKTTKNKAQEAVFSLMKASSYNNFDGEVVVDSLIKNQDKWIGCIWGRFGFAELIPLRDIENGYYNADTLYLKCPKEYVIDIKLLACEWDADEVGWLVDDELDGIIDENLKGIKDKLTLGTSHPDDNKFAYFRIWWD